MAEAAAAVPQHRFFCHSCKGEISPKLPVSPGQGGSEKGNSELPVSPGREGPGRVAPSCR